MDYDLPDETAYAETCATIGLMQWNSRMLQLDDRRKYLHASETAITFFENREECQNTDERPDEVARSAD
jgi:hypothetical protein